MGNTIAKAESYCRSLRTTDTAYKEAMLYAKYGAVLGIEMCKSIAERF